MELIKEIDQPLMQYSYNIRKASRGVVLNEQNQVAILHVTKKNYHKLPGGGLEGSETLYDALNREVLEEIGAKIKIINDIGLIIEYRNQFNQLQFSYCYLAKVVGEIKQPSFTSHEQKHGFVRKWVTLDEAIKTLSNDQPADYMGGFIQKRDLAYLLKAKEMLNK